MYQNLPIIKLIEIFWILCELYECILGTVNLWGYSQPNLTEQFLWNSSKSNVNLLNCLNFLSNQLYYVDRPDFIFVSVNSVLFQLCWAIWTGLKKQSSCSGILRSAMPNIDDLFKIYTKMFDRVCFNLEWFWHLHFLKKKKFCLLKKSSKN